MRKFIKKYLKFVIGIAVLLGFVFVFFTFARGGVALETGQLKHWRSASDARRATAVRMLVASDENMDGVIACVSKIAELPDSSDMAVRDAVELCFVGYQLKNNI